MESEIEIAIQLAIDKAFAEKDAQDSYGYPNVPSHKHTGEDSTAVLYAHLDEIQKFVQYRIVKHDSANATGTGIGGDFVMPFDGYIMSVGATVDTAGTTGSMTIDINKNATTILDTKITLDTTEKTSRTAATPFLFTDSQVITFETGDIFTFDVDGVQTTPAQGLTIFMNVIHNPQYGYSNL